jgi:hypothetical protein
VEIEGEIHHRSYQKEVQADKKAIAIYIPVTARILRKLDRYTTQPNPKSPKRHPTRAPSLTILGLTGCGFAHQARANYRVTALSNRNGGCRSATLTASRSAGIGCELISR